MGSCISHVDPESLKLHAEAEEILKKVCSRPLSTRLGVASDSAVFCLLLSVSEIPQQVPHIHSGGLNIDIKREMSLALLVWHRRANGLGAGTFSYYKPC